MSSIPPNRGTIGNTRPIRHLPFSTSSRYPGYDKLSWATPLPHGMSIFDVAREEVHHLHWVEQRARLWKEEHPDDPIQPQQPEDTWEWTEIKPKSSPALFTTASFSSATPTRLATPRLGSDSNHSSPAKRARTCPECHVRWADEVEPAHSPKWRKGRDSPERDVPQKTLVARPHVTYHDGNRIQGSKYGSEEERLKDAKAVHENFGLRQRK